jgi:hypothetical protein
MRRATSCGQAATAPASVSEVLPAAPVRPLLAEAPARWHAAGAGASALHGADVRITDLGGTAPGRPATRSFQTVNGTATTGDGDSIARTGTLTFAPGETSKTITIAVNGDGKKEADETFSLDLFGNSGNSLFTKKRGLGTILNDD